jgi:hypothetical protein
MKSSSIAVWGLLVFALCWGAASAGQSATPSSSVHSSARPSGHKKKHHSSGPKQKAPTPDRISEIQSALSRGGYYQGEPNGKWDGNTVAAVEKFQSANGMEGSGKLDAPTLQKLGLGSDIAGVSAPKPVTPRPPTSQSASPSGGGATTAVNSSPGPPVEATQK